MSGVQRAGGQVGPEAAQFQAEVQQAALGGQAASPAAETPAKQPPGPPSGGPQPAKPGAAREDARGGESPATLRGRLFAPGKEAPVSGQYVAVDGSGRRAGKEKTIAAGEPFPPTARPGLSYKLVDATKHSAAAGVGGAVTGKPGQTAPRSGQYELVDASGRPTDRASTVAKGEPFPPTPKPGQTWRLIDASGTRRSGETAEISGQYAVVGKNGKPTGDEVTVVKGEPFPPTPRGGQAYRLADVTKHVRPEKAEGQFRPGQTVKTSGQYELIAADGRKTGREVTAVRGEPFPPAPRPGQTYRQKDVTAKDGAAAKASGVGGVGRPGGATRPTEAIRNDFLAASERKDNAGMLRVLDEVVRPLLGPDGRLAAKPDAAAMERFFEVADPILIDVNLANGITFELARVVYAAGPETQALYDAIFAKAPKVKGDFIGAMGDEPGEGTDLHQTRWSSATSSNIYWLVRNEMNAANPADRLKTINSLLEPHLKPGPLRPGESILKPGVDMQQVYKAIGSFGWMANEGGFERLIETVRAAGPGVADRLTRVLYEAGGHTATEWFNTIAKMDSAAAGKEPRIAATFEAMKPLIDGNPWGAWKLKENPSPADVDRFRAALAAVPRGELGRLAFAAYPEIDSYSPPIQQLDAAIRSAAPAEMKQQWELASAGHMADRLRGTLDRGLQYPAAKILERLADRFAEDKGTIWNGPAMKLNPGANAADIARFRTVLTTLESEGRLHDVARAAKEGGPYHGPVNPPQIGLTRMTQLIADPAVGTDALRRAWSEATRGL